MDMNFSLGLEQYRLKKNLIFATFKGSNHLNIIRKFEAPAHKMTDRRTCFLFTILLVRVEGPLCDEMD